MERPGARRDSRPRSGYGSVVRILIFRAVALAVPLTCLLVPSALAAAPAPEWTSGARLERAQPKCLESATRVAVTKLRTPRGGSAGKAVITVSTEQQGDFSYVVCAVTEVAKRYQRHSNIVRQTFHEFGSDGDLLGEVRADTYATRAKPLLFGSSFVPAGHRYVFKVRIEGGTKASGTARFELPAAG
jgi:hypothetical protein